MDELVALIHSLSRVELKQLKNEIDNKMLEAVNLIEKKGNITHSEIAKIIYKDPKSKAFIVMKKRLIGYIHEVIANSVVFMNNQTIEADPMAFAYSAWIRDFSIAINLLKRGLMALAQQHLEVNCLYNSQGDVYPAFKLIVWEYYRGIIRKAISNKAFQEFEEKITQIRKQADLLHKAQALYDEYENLTTMKEYSRVNFFDFLNGAIDTLEKGLAEVYDIKTHYYYLNFKWVWCERSAKPEGKIIVQEMLVLLEKYPQLFDNQKHGLLWGRLAMIELSLCQFAQVYENCNKAITFLVNRKKHIALLAQYKAVACFYLGNWDEVVALEMYNNQYLIDEYRMTKYLYPCMRACIAYLKKDYKAAKRYIQEAEDNAEAKLNIVTSLRIFELMILIEEGDWDFMTNQLENMRKFQTNNNVIGRDVEIYKLLNRLSRQIDSLKWSEIKTAVDAMNRSTPWHPFSIEMIRFDVWLESYLEKTDYWQNFQTLVSNSY